MAGLVFAWDRHAANYERGARQAGPVHQRCQFVLGGEAVAAQYLVERGLTRGRYPVMAQEHGQSGAEQEGEHGPGDAAVPQQAGGGDPRQRILRHGHGGLLPGAEQCRRVEPLGNLGADMRDGALAIGLAGGEEGERDACYQSQERQHEPYPQQDKGRMEAVGFDGMAATD